MDDDICCDSCAKIANSLNMNTRNISTLYDVLISESLLTVKTGDKLITNPQNG